MTVGLRKRLRHAAQRSAHCLVFGTTAYRNERIWVRPSALTHHAAIGIPGKRHGRIRFGGWDADGGNFEDTWRMISCRQHWLIGENWETSGAYHHMLAEIAESSSGSADGCRTIEDIIARYSRLDVLYEQTKAHGMRSLGEVVDGRIVEQDPIIVHVRRDGRLCIGAGGAHRLAMAKCLDLDRIPAGLGLIHAKFARQLRYRRSVQARHEDWYIG